MNEQIGWRALINTFKDEAPHYAHMIPQLPRLLHDALKQQAHPRGNQDELLRALLREQRRTNLMLQGLVWAVGGFVIGAALVKLVGWWLVHG
jgi:ubiquinone biosynthesis protein